MCLDHLVTGRADNATIYGYPLCPHCGVFTAETWGATLLHSHSLPIERNLESAGLYFIMNGKINAYYFF
jgi:hypothetical protein